MGTTPRRKQSDDKLSRHIARALVRGGAIKNNIWRGQGVNMFDLNIFLLVPHTYPPQINCRLQISFVHADRNFASVAATLACMHAMNGRVQRMDLRQVYDLACSSFDGASPTFD